MNERLAELELKRQTLVLQSAVLRGDIAAEGAAIQGRFSQVDRGLAALRSLTSSPWLIAGAGALVVVLGPVRALRWAGRGLVGLTLARRALRLLDVGRTDSR